MTVLLLSNMYPSPTHPAFGIFVSYQVEFLQTHHRCRMKLVVAREDPGSWPGKVLKYVRLHLRAWAALFTDLDVIHLHYASSAHIIAAAPILLLRRKPLVVTIHRGEIYTLPGRGLRRFLVHRFLVRARAVICVSKDLEVRLREGLEIAGSKLSVIDVGCDLGRFRPSLPPEKERAKMKVGLPPDRFALLFVGSLIARKGLDVLLRAVSILEARDRIQIVIAGSGPDREQLESEAEARGLSPQILWLGERSHQELPDWYAAADLFVLPSRSEGTPTVVLEAMASGCPILATRVGGIPEVVTDGLNGLLFDPDDDHQLAGCITRLLEDSELRERLARRAINDAAEHSIERQADRIAQIYRAVSGRGRPAGCGG